MFWCRFPLHQSIESIIHNCWDYQGPQGPHKKAVQRGCPAFSRWTAGSQMRHSRRTNLAMQGTFRCVRDAEKIVDGMLEVYMCRGLYGLLLFFISRLFSHKRVINPFNPGFRWCWDDHDPHPVVVRKLCEKLLVLQLARVQVFFGFDNGEKRP